MGPRHACALSLVLDIDSSRRLLPLAALLVPHSAYGQERTKVVQAARGQHRVHNGRHLLAFYPEILQCLYQQIRWRRRIHLIKQFQMYRR